jgi:broad specificity phosphatase PhoE
MPKRKFYTPEDFSKAMIDYEHSPVIPKEINLDSINWEICYCSTIPRAVKTAEKIFCKEIRFTNLIVEVPISPFTNRKLFLPSFWWHLGGRIAWYKNHDSQLEGRKDTLKRINLFVKELNDSENEKILIVTHGFFMRIFVEELFKIGFKGKIDIRPKNGKLYLFQKLF